MRWANANGGGTQFTNTGLPIGPAIIAGKDYDDNGNTDGPRKPAQAISAAWRRASGKGIGPPW